MMYLETSIDCVDIKAGRRKRKKKKKKKGEKDKKKRRGEDEKDIELFHPLLPLFPYYYYCNSAYMYDDSGFLFSRNNTCCSRSDPSFSLLLFL